jgi:Sec-independent protein translocase protein TatA
MPIQVGDAVLTFLGDSTQLDAAIDRINEETPAKLEPASTAIKEVAGNWEFAGSTASTAGSQAVIAGEEMAEAGEKASRGFGEAKGTLALLGEETGVRLPRHVRSFVAELPGVGEALNAAFSTFAVIALISVIIEGTKKLTEFISEHFIFTEAMKEEQKAIIELNSQLLEHNKKIKELTDQYSDFSLNGSQKTRAEFERLTEEVHKNELALNDASNYLYQYNHGIEGTAEGAATASNKLLLLNTTLKEQALQQALLSATFNKQVAEEQAQHDSAKIAAAKTVGEALISLQEAQQRVRVSQLTVSFAEEAAVEAQAEERKYNTELQYMERRLAILKRDPTKNVDAIRELNAQIEAAEEQHEAQRLTKYADFLDKLKAIRQQKIDTIISSAPDKIESDAVNQLEKLDEAFSKLGIQGTSQLYANLLRAKEGYETLRSSGLASTGDLIRAQMSLLNVQILYDSQFGKDTTKQRRELQGLQDEYDKLVNHVDKSVSKINQLMALYVKDVHNAGNQTKFFADLGKLSLDDFAKSAGSAFDSFLQHQSSFGEAMKQATASTLDSIASMAFANAIYFTAWGIADTFWNPARAGADFASAAEFAAIAAVAGSAGYALGSGSSSSASTSGGDSGPQGAAVQGTPAATPAPQGPNQRVQAFASGGLVTGPTMAVLGDSVRDSGSQSEAAIPLDDPQAVAKIKEALGGDGGDHYHFHIGGMVSADTMKKTMQKMTSMAKKNQGRVTANNSFKLTKRG